MATITGTKEVQEILNGLRNDIAGIGQDYTKLKNTAEAGLNGVNWRLSRPTPEPLQEGNIGILLGDAKKALADLNTKVTALTTKLGDTDFVALANRPDPAE